MQQKETSPRLAPLIDRLSGRRILVIGDMVADVYIDGRISRISREAPVLVLEQAGEKIIAGGAANVVHNCATLGGTVTAVGLVGDDRQADGISSVLENAGVDTSGLLRDAERPTISKTRIIAGGRATVSQQIVRLDRESHAPMSRAMESAMLRYLDGVLPETDGIVLSDYGAGTITEAVKGKLIGYAREHDIPSIVDSRYGIHRFSGIGYVKQNDAELAAAVGRKLPDAPAIYAAGRELLEELGADGVLVTRGELGMVLVEKDGSVSDIPVTDKSEVYDVSGAGDTVIEIKEDGTEDVFLHGNTNHGIKINSIWPADGVVHFDQVIRVWGENYSMYTYALLRQYDAETGKSKPAILTMQYEEGDPEGATGKAEEKKRYEEQKRLFELGIGSDPGPEGE